MPLGIIVPNGYVDPETAEYIRRNLEEIGEIVIPQVWEGTLASEVEFNMAQPWLAASKKASRYAVFLYGKKKPGRMKTRKEVHNRMAAGIRSRFDGEGIVFTLEVEVKEEEFEVIST